LVYQASSTEKDLKKALIESVKDPTMLEEIIHQYLEESRKRMNR